jgi:hypothetical protein
MTQISRTRGPCLAWVAEKKLCSEIVNEKEKCTRFINVADGLSIWLKFVNKFEMNKQSQNYSFHFGF